ncbi:Zn(II)/Cd(II)/Pb(II) translocating P-type ATPase ZntA [Cronobacter muytjensii]|uniref:Zn(II)/Cd(II)/Pb(II) translocating P-type ATPase ZntA n=1 Tax=Cronobacter muytjensii TaxID=413501 RepID=UPI002A154C7D|nr:Zn(II)/Cd(II)/Pb(II) translocating P-type ATPase ZntA [Cronobacter muytjensii]ELY6274800.1 Zn(II)/Cd(II)/Pb(II) translocating P-type ATPase ZntA [Cronobacter muytjensii]MEB8641460.1 Zn(II)/Cd(II)/Pb(II) translocating P-type ATPase ZntA [Cronobacter muytjensii]
MSTPSEKPRVTPQFAKMTLTPMPQKLSGGEAPCCSGGACDAPQPAGEATGALRWQVAGMDCAACARKVENAVRQVAQVRHVQVLFATEKLVVDAPPSQREAIEQAVRAAGYTLRDMHTAAPAASSAWRENLPILIIAALMALSWTLEQFHPQAGRAAFIVTTLVGLFPVARQAWRLTRSGNPFAIETLMSVAATGALIIGASEEAAMVLLLYLVGERLEGWAANRARSGVSALVALRPETAVRLRGDARETVAISALQPGDVIEVAAGGRLPADGKLLGAAASFDESALTGESLPVEHQPGDNIPAGATSVDRLVSLEVTSRPGESAIDRILHLIEEAEAKRAPIERFIDRFSRLYTPAIMAAALLTALIPPLLFAAPWLPWIYKALALLLIGCPCALVISTPAAITSGLAAATRFGALIKGGAALEALGRVEQIAFDKTGTLTAGTPQVTSISPVTGLEADALLAFAAAVEQGSTHPLAQAVVREASERGVAVLRAGEQRTLAGVGVEAQVEGRRVRISAPDKVSIALPDEWRQRIRDEEAQGQTVIVVTASDQLLGTLALRDTQRADARDAVGKLRAMGIQSVMLTGDNPRAAAAIAKALGMDYRAGLLPADKVGQVNTLNARAPLAVVGDGINDAPAMKAATIGIAMGSGTDVALEAADAALTHNRLAALPEMIALARATHRNIRQNIAIALGLKAVFLVTTLLGLTGLWLAVLADTGATVLVTANALRLLRRRG